MGARFFTPGSARIALGALRRDAEVLSRTARAMRAGRFPPPVPDRPVHPTYFTLLTLVSATIERLHASGARVADLAEGALDFPARRRGRTVLLCWRVGEPELRYWHEVDAGLEGRRPVDESGPWDDESVGGPGEGAA